MENLKDMPNLENVEKREAISSKIVNLIKDRNTLRTEYNKRPTRKLKSTVNEYRNRKVPSENFLTKFNFMNLLEVNYLQKTSFFFFQKVSTMIRPT